MCGIAGIYAYSSSQEVDQAELSRINDAMTPRGPDGSGQWHSEHSPIGLAHRRLAIIDPTTTGAQPMRDVEHDLTITYNGEIYNYKELQRYLASKGYHVRTGSDTEVLLGLYAVDGEAMTERLRGMYAFAIWDEKRKRLFAARDPHGIKPFYFSNDRGVLRFASSIKALLAGGAVSRQLDPAGQVGFLLLGYVPDPFTIRAAIEALPAGHTLTVELGGEPDIRRFFDIADLLRKQHDAAPVALEERRARLREAMDDTIAHHLVADVPVGFFLSAGVDSTTLIALAAMTGHEHLKTVTLGFDIYRGTDRDERGLAEAVAKAYGTEHQSIEIGQAEFAGERDRLLHAMDQPSVDGTNTYFVSRAAVSAGLKTTISGTGGDEFLQGYPSFTTIPKVVRTVGRLPGAAIAGGMMRRVAGPLISRMTSPKYASLFELGTNTGDAYLLRRGLYLPWELPSVLDPDIVRVGWERLNLRARLRDDAADISTLEGQVAALEMNWYMRGQLLRDADWAGMAHSLEIRVPLVDRVLLASLADIVAGPTRLNKLDLASLPDQRMPDAIRHRKKTGFHVPVRDWLMAESDGPTERKTRGWARFLLDHVDA